MLDPPNQVTFFQNNNSFNCLTLFVSLVKVTQEWVKVTQEWVKVTHEWVKVTQEWEKLHRSAKCVPDTTNLVRFMLSTDFCFKIIFMKHCRAVFH